MKLKKLQMIRNLVMQESMFLNFLAKLFRNLVWQSEANENQFKPKLHTRHSGIKLSGRKRNKACHQVQASDNLHLVITAGNIQPY